MESNFRFISLDINFHALINSNDSVCVQKRPMQLKLVSQFMCCNWRRIAYLIIHFVNECERACKTEKRMFDNSMENCGGLTHNKHNEMPFLTHITHHTHTKQYFSSCEPFKSLWSYDFLRVKYIEFLLRERENISSMILMISFSTILWAT